MQTLILKVNDSVIDKFFWLLKHFDKSEIEILDFDTHLEALVEKGMKSPISELTHEEVFSNLRAKYAQN